MRYIEVEPKYVSDEILDMITRGDVIVRNVEGRKQTLFVPETIELRHFDPENKLIGNLIDDMKRK